MSWWDIARSQDGVISRAQLRGVGQSKACVDQLIASGQLEIIRRGCYLVRGAPMTYRARLWAAILMTSGVLGFDTAAHLWGVTFEQPDRVHVIVERQRHLKLPHWVALHRVDLPANTVREQGGFTVTKKSWTVLDYLTTLQPGRAGELVDRAVQRRWIVAADIERRLIEQPRRKGNPTLRSLGTRLGDGAAAHSERILHRLLRRASLSGWRPNYSVWVGGELVAVVDVALPERKLAIEVDGMAWHTDADRFQRDRSRQNQLVALGWTVLRFTWADLNDRPDYVVRSIQHMCA